VKLFDYFYLLRKIRKVTTVLQLHQPFYILDRTGKQLYLILGFVDLEGGIDRLSRNVGKELSLHTA
jgi:hypothetical protein